MVSLTISMLRVQRQEVKLVKAFGKMRVGGEKRVARVRGPEGEVELTKTYSLLLRTPTLDEHQVYV